jgi:hypothetical protein
MRISTLTGMAFYLNGALGSGKYAGISIAEVKARIEAGDIFPYLEQTLGDDIDVSLLTPDDQRELNDEWADMAVSIDEDRKMAVVGNGLCLLVAYLLEGLQRRWLAQR